MTGPVLDTKPLKVLMISSVWPSDRHPGWVPFLVDQVNSLENNGVDIEVLSFYGRGNPIIYAYYWLVVHWKYLFGGYDLVHAQFGQSGIVSAPTTLPLVVTFHGSDLQGWVGDQGSYPLGSKIMQLMSRYVARHADQVIVVSSHLNRYLPPGISTKVIPCGIDLENFRPIPQEEARNQLDLPLDERLILFVGDKANPIKQYTLAKKAIDLLNEKNKVRLVVASGVSHKLMPIYMNASDALVLTSRHEGSPTVVKEALACNLPVVSLDVGDVRQRLDGLSGCVVCDNDSAETIADALLQVIHSGRLENGFQSIQNLSLDRISREIIDIYHTALMNSQSMK
jgi:teichuronic acid biosynthesis glycosyltransferase TuaC